MRPDLRRAFTIGSASRDRKRRTRQPDQCEHPRPRHRAERLMGPRRVTPAAFSQAGPCRSRHCAWSSPTLMSERRRPLPLGMGGASSHSPGGECLIQPKPNRIWPEPDRTLLRLPVRAEAPVARRSVSSGSCLPDPPVSCPPGASSGCPSDRVRLAASWRSCMPVVSVCARGFRQEI